MNGPVARAALLAASLLAVVAEAQVFPVFQGDPVDGLGRARFVLPGVPLSVENEDGDFNPPVIVPGTIGDVDLVVRAGTVSAGATMPPPALVPPVAGAGGSRFPGGVDLPFTVIVSDGDPTVAGGHPLLGPEMDGIPVLVVAFADLDGDGVVGPTSDDPAGAADNGREMQESSYPVGMRVAYFTGGVAEGVIAIDVGAPESAALTVVLTAAAYVGQFSPDFFLGTVPDGPPIATLMPFFPRLDPDRVIDTDGSAGPALPDGRIGVEFEDEFDPPVGHPQLGTPFALPTDGSSVTIDRAFVRGGAASRLRFVREASATGFTGEEARLPLRPDTAGVLTEPLPPLTVVDNGPGGGVSARLVPIDVLGNVTDPDTALAARVVVSAGLAITQPDTDGDPSAEPLSVSDAAGISIVVDDAGGAGDSGATGSVTVEVGGAAVERLAVALTDGPPPVGTPPVLVHARFLGSDVLSVSCPSTRTLLADVTDVDGDATGVDATLSIDGTSLGTVVLAPSSLPVPLGIPPGDVFATALRLKTLRNPGTLTVDLVARDAASLASSPLQFAIPVVATAPPEIGAVTVSPASVPPGTRTQLTVTAAVADECKLRRVLAQRERSGSFKRLVRLNDRGKRGDVTAGDGIFTGTRKLRPADEEPIAIRVEAKDRSRQTVVSDPVTVPVTP
jgi:hypothetical protein